MMRELEQVLGPVVGVRARVDQHRRRRARVGIGTAIAGRSTPGRRRRWSRPAASIAPVFPAETTASARPSATARTAATSEESGFARTASAGFSAMSIASGASTSSSPPVSSPAGPKSVDVDPVGGRLERAGDDLAGSAVPAQRVDRDAALKRYGALKRSGSTSRPLYVPQVGQTRCGRFGELHCGQMFTRGASIACVRAALVAARLRGLSLRDCHERRTL